jgi:hypothetical protein
LRLPLKATDINGMSTVRKPRLQSPSDRLPLLLVINNEVRGTRRRHPALFVMKLMLFAAILFGTLNMFHGIARG